MEISNKTRNFAFIMLELNNVRLKCSPLSFTMMARNGQLTVLNQPPLVSHSLFNAILGFEPPLEGFISIDGEPLGKSTIHAMRRLMAWVPDSLEAVGETYPYQPPTVQDIFALKANRELPVSNGLLAEEIRKTGASGNKATLLAVGVLLRRPILLIEQPSAASVHYLLHQAGKGTTVIVASQDPAYTATSNT